MLQHELGRLTEGSRSVGEQRLIEHAAAFAALGGGLTHQQAMNVIEQVTSILGIACPEGPGTIVERLYVLLPDADHGVAPIVPDILAEALVLRVFGGSTAQAQEALLLEAMKLLRHRVVPFVIRAAQDFASEKQPLPLKW